MLLFLLPVNWKAREFTISWGQAVKIDWGTLLLFGGGITLGNLMFEFKLAEVIGKNLLAMSGATSLWGITFGAIFIAILVSETSSNTASANMVVPVMISLAQAAGVNPIPPAIGATLGASWGFMLPVSTPPNAIVYGSGMVPITKMIRAGIFFDILGGLVIWPGCGCCCRWWDWREGTSGLALASMSQVLTKGFSSGIKILESDSNLRRSHRFIPVLK